jgi:hypothetical protein
MDLVKQSLGKQKINVRAVRTGLKGTTCNGVSWIRLVQNRDQHEALVDTVMKFRDK